MGGFDSRDIGLIYRGGKQEIQDETKRLLEISGTTGLMLGADCTLPSDINYDHVRWVVEAAEEYGAGK